MGAKQSPKKRQRGEFSQKLTEKLHKCQSDRVLKPLKASPIGTSRKDNLMDIYCPIPRMTAKVPNPLKLPVQLNQGQPADEDPMCTKNMSKTCRSHVDLFDRQISPNAQ